MQPQVILITGASSGFGKITAQMLSEQGHIVYGTSRKPSEDMNHVKMLVVDVTNSFSVCQAVERILSEQGRIDVLINNAGVPYGGLLTMTPVDKLRKVYDINVFAQVQIMQLVARQMMRQKSGCIINMCSVGGIEASPGYLAYGSSKAALIWITKSVSRELGSYGIRVNGIAPGLIDTDMGNYKSKEELDKVLNRTSIMRMGKPEEVAKAALYIASEDASYMTGQILVIDGGRV